MLYDVNLLFQSFAIRCVYERCPRAVDIGIAVLDLRKHHAALQKIAQQFNDAAAS